MMNREEILTALKDVVAMPTCAHKEKAQSLLEDPNSKLSELTRVIEHDPGLTINLLKIVNASFYANSEPLLTAREAVERVGDTEMLQFIISTGVAPCFVEEFLGYDLSPAMLMQHSVSVAMAARSMGRILDLDVPEYVFTAGLLAGVGKTVLGAYTNVDGRAILQLALDKGWTFARAEKKLLGINHAEIGAKLMEQWGMPDELTRVVRYHLDPDMYDEDDIVIDLVHMGNILAKMIGVGLGVDGLNYMVCSNVIDRLGVTPEDVDMVSAEVVVELGTVWDLFITCDADSEIIGE